MPLTTPAKIGYLDCFSGASGDMILGALLDAGLDEGLLMKELGKLPLPGLQVEVTPVTLQAIRAVQVTVTAEEKQQLRTLPVIEQLLQRSTLDDDIVSRTLQVFRALAEAEATVHRTDINKVHFHEVGAVDTIVDIVGTIFGLSQLGIGRLVCSPLPAGRGFVQCAHGLLPLPAPAVCELLKKVPVYGVELKQELVTPTGAALIATLADSFGPMPAMIISSTGYGAGTQVLSNGQPNLLRILVGDDPAVTESQIVEVIETNLDDWSPEGFPYLCDQLFNQGALDVTLCPVHMKKGRPGFMLQVISPPPKALTLKECILSETTAIGLRFRREARQTLPREIITITTRWGELKAKKVHTPSGIVLYPEYEQCRRVAAQHKISLQEVYNEVRSSEFR